MGLKLAPTQVGRSPEFHLASFLQGREVPEFMWKTILVKGSKKKKALNVCV